MINYDKELAFAKNLAAEAGQMILTGFNLPRQTVWKADNSPLTETDTAINQFVIEQVKKEFPGDGVLGEEDSYEQNRSRAWVVDPVDGTQSFDLGSPLSTFCLSLVIDGQPVLGLIQHPFSNRLYWASQGQGAFVDNDPIHVSAARTLEQNYLILSSRMIGENLKTTGQIFDIIEQRKAKAFNFRSFAYGSTFVANGSAVATMIGIGNPWDVAATKIIVEEAGGKVTDVNGQNRLYNDQGNGLVASNGIVHDQILELIKK